MHRTTDGQNIYESILSSPKMIDRLHIRAGSTAPLSQPEESPDDEPEVEQPLLAMERQSSEPVLNRPDDSSSLVSSTGRRIEINRTEKDEN